MGIQWRLLQDRHTEAWTVAAEVGKKCTPSILFPSRIAIQRRDKRMSAVLESQFMFSLPAILERHKTMPKAWIFLESMTRVLFRLACF